MNHKIIENYKRIQGEMAQLQIKCRRTTPVRIVAASKYADVSDIQTLLHLGLKSMGENRVQDAISKSEEIGRENAEWHMIGHLQTNKVNKAVALFDWIQSVDSTYLMEAIDQASAKQNKVMNMLLQFNVANEQTKFGCNETELFLLSNHTKTLSHLKFRGIMIIAPHINDQNLLRQYFDRAKKIFDRLKELYPHVDTLSMGMSEDYKMAIEAGATMVRIGSALFR